jgi:hypothetical protein
VEVALGRGPVPEVHDGAGVAPVEPRPQRPPHRVEHLARHRDGDLREPRLQRVGDATVAGPPVEVHVLDQVDAPDHGHPHLTVGGEHEVFLGQGVRAADLGRLLADQRGIDGQLPLPLEGRGLQVDHPGHQHGPVHGPKVLVLQIQGLLGVGVHDGAIGSQDLSGVVGPGLNQRFLRIPPGSEPEHTPRDPSLLLLTKDAYFGRFGPWFAWHSRQW